MDERLLAWARAVKRRRNTRLPTLWLFTDADRLPDPLPVIARLPGHLCGVVFRHDAALGRAALAAKVAKLCRARNLPLVIAGDARLAAALHAGIHLRGGAWPDRARPAAGLRTASVHDLPELRRAQKAGADILFVSPAFATVSHPRQPARGAVRWAALARRATGGKAYALGGISGQKIKRLAGFCCGAAAIDQLKP